jgi:hypothetical protein
MHLNIRMSILCAVALGCANAQWLNYKDASTPRIKAGQPNLSAPAPRLNGKPDLSGVWEAEPTAQSKLKAALGAGFFELQIDVPNLSKYAVNLLWDFKPETDPTRPEAAAILKQRGQNAGKDLPTSRCLPGSVPLTYLILPFKILQTSQQLVMLFEHYDPARQIYTDKRPLPKDSVPSWMGYSSAEWQGDTLTVESAGFNDKTWLDVAGHPRSESMRITERFHRRDFGHMDLHLTINDPTYYTRPFDVKIGFRLIPDSDVLEAVCAENEKDRAHMGDR